jgi:hypothetical protein
MREERGQASIEWIGAVLLVVLALTGLARLALRGEAADLGASPLRTTICAARGGCAEQREAAPARARDRRTVIVPPLLPVHPEERRPARTPRLLRRLGSPATVQRARRAAGTFWRRSWLVCFGYERVRYGLLHPETRPRQTVPISGALQMINDCASPIDFARDWELLRPR